MCIAGYPSSESFREGGTAARSVRCRKRQIALFCLEEECSLSAAFLTRRVAKIAACHTFFFMTDSAHIRTTNAMIDELSKTLSIYDMRSLGYKSGINMQSGQVKRPKVLADLYAAAETNVSLLNQFKKVYDRSNDLYTRARIKKENRHFGDFANEMSDHDSDYDD